MLLMLRKFGEAPTPLKEKDLQDEKGVTAVISLLSPFLVVISRKASHEWCQPGPSGNL